MWFLFRFFSMCFLLSISSFYHAQAAEHFAEVVYPKQGGLANLTLNDISSDGKYSLFRTNQRNVEGDSSGADSSFYDIYLRNNLDGTVTKISKSYDNKYASRDSGQAVFVGSDEIVFSSTANNIVENEDYSYKYYRYSISTKKIIKLEVPNSLSEYSSSMVSSENGKFVYVGSQNRLYKLNNDKSKFELINISFDNQIKVLDVSDDGRLLISDYDYQASKLVLLDSDQTFRELYSDTSSRYEYTDAAISNNGQYAVYVNSAQQEINIVDLNSSGLTSQILSDVPLAETEILNEGVDISHDGAYVFVVTKPVYSLQQTNNTNSRTSSIFVFEVNSAKAFNASVLSNSYRQGIFNQAHFANADNSLYFVGSEVSSNLPVNIIKQSILPSLFEFSGEISNLTLASESPLSATISITSSNKNFRIKRTNIDTQKSAYLTSNKLQSVDFKFGLEPGNYEYTAVPCSVHLVCDELASITKQIKIKGFSSPPALKIEKTIPTTLNQNSFISISSELKENSSVTEVNYLGNYNVYLESEPFKITLNNSMDIGLFSRFCVKNYDNSLGCDSYTAPQIVKSPNNLSGTQISVLPLPDFSAIKVEWLKTANYTYQLYRSVSQTRYTNSDFELVYSGEDSKFIDVKTNIGAYVSYKLVQCLDGLCTTSVSHNDGQKVSRNSTPISINVSSSQGIGIIDVNLYYAFDQIKLYRIEENSSEPEEYITDIDLNKLQYIDQLVIPKSTYSYRVEGCYQGQCGYEYTVRKYVNELNIDLIPTTPKNLKAIHSHFMGATISWDKVTGADGYLVHITSSDLRSKSTLTAIGNETSSVIHRYKNSLGSHFNYSVSSFKYDNRNTTNIAVRSLPSDTVSLNSIESITQQTLLPVIVNIPNTQTNYPYYTIQLESSPAFESYKILKRVKGQGELSLDRESLLSRYNSSVDLSEQVENDTTYEYFIVGCSSIYNTCSDKQGPIEVTFYADKSIPIVDTSPTLSWDSAGFLKIQPNIPHSNHISSISAKLYNSSSSTSYFQSQSINGATGEFESTHHSLKVNESVFVSTEYCFRGENSSYQCSKDSLRASITLPANAKIKPNTPSIYNFKTEALADSATVNLDLRFETSGIRAAEEIHVFKAINNEELKLIKVEKNIQSRFVEGLYQYIETDIVLGQSIRYQVQLCNSVGCSLPSQSQGTTLTDIRKLAIPEVPSIKSVTDGELFSRVKVEIERTDLATSYRLYVAEELKKMDSYETITTRIYDKSNLSTDTLYYFSLAACNSAGCSEKSEPISHKTLGLISSLKQISGLQLWEAAQNSSSQSIWQVSSRNITASNGRLDTMQGTAKLNQWVNFNEGAESQTQTLLSIKDLNSCTSLMSFGLKLPSSTNQNIEHARTLFEFIYTGAGCADNSDLELYSLYIDSDYLEKPILIDKKDEWLDKWLTFNLHVNELGQIILLKGDSEVFKTIKTLELNILGYSQLFWTASPNSWISHMAIKSLSDQAVKLDFQQVRPSSNTISVKHPRVVEVRYPSSLSVELVPIIDGNYAELLAFSATPSSDSNWLYAYLTELKPKQTYEWLVRHCDGEVCGPFYYDKETTPVYATSINQNAPYKGYSSVEGELVLYNYFNSSVDDYTLYGRKSDETEPTEIATLSYLDIVNNANDPSLNYVYWTVTNYQPNDQVYFSLKVCNPIICKTTAETGLWTIPIDTDQDGVIDELDKFPNDPDEAYDTDGDGIGNNADQDDDGDGLPDEVEVLYGLNPLYNYDAQQDLDGDGYSNVLEHLIGSSFDNSASTPKSKGIFISFENDEKLPVTITSLFAQNSYRGAVHGQYSLEKRFSSVRDDRLVIKHKGKMKAGRLGWAYRIYNTFSIQITINGQLATNDDAQITSLGNSWQWRSIAVPKGYAEIEIQFSGGSDIYATGLNLDALFIPMEKPEGDLDGDLKADIVWRNQQDGRNVLWSMNGSAISQSLDINPVRDTNWQIAGRGDFSGDGKSDILWRNKVSGANTIFSMDGAKIISSDPVNPVRDINWQVKGIRDFDGDGKADILWRHASKGDTVIFLMDGHNIKLSQGVKTVADLNWEIASVGDLNGDGLGDVLWRHKRYGKNLVWQMDGATLAKSYLTKTVDNSWTLVGLGDLDGNGSDDIIWRNKQDGRNWVHLMKDGQVWRSAQINVVADSNWYIADVLDLNGDGKDDLFWRNKADGSTYVYLMDGVTIQQRGHLKTVSQVWQNIH